VEEPNGEERRTVYLLGLTSMINDASSEAIYAILPYYVDNLALIGLFGGLFNGLGNALKLVFGYLSDRFARRKPLVMLGYLVSAASKTSMALVSSALLPVLIVLDRIGKGIRDSPRDAILSTVRARGFAFSVHRALDTTGALLGTLLAYYLLSNVGDYRFAMLVAGMLGFFTIFPLLFVPEPKGALLRRSFGDALAHLSAGVKHFLLPAVLFGFAAISPMLFITTAKTEESFYAILLYALYNLFYVLSATFIGRSSDRFGRGRIMILGGTLIALAYLAMYAGSYVLGFLLYGLGIGAFLPAAFAHIGDVSKERGTAMGVFQSVYGISVLISSTLFGYLLGILGPLTFVLYAVFPVAAVLSVLSLR